MNFYIICDSFPERILACLWTVDTTLDLRDEEAKTTFNRLLISSKWWMETIHYLGSSWREIIQGRMTTDVWEQLSCLIHKFVNLLWKSLEMLWRNSWYILWKIFNFAQKKGNFQRRKTSYYMYMLIQAALFNLNPTKQWHLLLTRNIYCDFINFRNLSEIRLDRKILTNVSSKEKEMSIKIFQSRQISPRLQFSLSWSVHWGAISKNTFYW